MSIFDDFFRKKLLSSIRTVQDYPQKGVLFRDITTLLNNAEIFCELISRLTQHYKNHNIDFVAGIESRGFIFATALAYTLKAGFVPIRKKGKLPWKTFSEKYELEYGKDELEIHQDAFLNREKPKVLLVDDLIATGGTALSALTLIKKAGGEPIGACFLLCLSNLLNKDLELETLHILEL